MYVCKSDSKKDETLENRDGISLIREITLFWLKIYEVDFVVLLLFFCNASDYCVSKHDSSLSLASAKFFGFPYGDIFVLHQKNYPKK